MMFMLTQYILVLSLCNNDYLNFAEVAFPKLYFRKVKVDICKYISDNKPDAYFIFLLQKQICNILYSTE